jgi:predicted ATPase
MQAPPDPHNRSANCIAWSYDLLSPDEQDVLCRLAVFVSGCSTEAVEDVVPDLGTTAFSPAAVVRSLIDKSLLIASWSDGEEPRLTMLETIREYALERLEERGLTEQACAAYALYYARLAEDTEAAMWRPEEALWLRRMAVERDNLRAVLAWTLQHDVELGLRIGGALRRFWNFDGHFGEWRTWIDGIRPRTDLPGPG